ncbi:helix-turn-helix domain-containing protein [Acinetobacter sp. YH12080]|uniref:helix-turn-helix domain-containing protein n=1 Tax=Acinetobacter sp. YH12080 TaxID=2601073 RepID=UPI0015D3A9E5
MSIDATRWAWAVSVNNSSQRLVLLSLADRAGEDHTAWPSIDRLAKDTVLDKKTVQKVLIELMKLQLIIDTGERTGPTKRVKILKLNGVKGREEYTQNRDDLNSKKDIKSKVNQPNNGNIKQPQNRDYSNFENNPQNGILNDPKIGVQNLSGNLSINLSCEHDWMPDLQSLEIKLKIAGHEKNTALILGLPSFEFELSAFNSHFDGQVMSDAKKLHKFTAWIIDKFERYKKVNPHYVNQAELFTEAAEQPAINLADSKPKSLLGSMQ